MYGSHQGATDIDCPCRYQSQKLIAKKGHYMLSDRGKGVWTQAERERAKRRKLVPMLGRIAQNPLDRAGVVIDRDDKVFRLDTINESSDFRYAVALL